MCVCALVGSVGVFLAQGRARVRFKKQSDAIPSQKRDQESSSGQFDRVKEAAFQTSTSPRSPPSTSTPARAAKIDHPWPARFCAGPFPLVPRRLRPPRPCGAFADATSAAGGGGVLRKPAGRGGLERGTASQTQRRALAIRRRRQPANHRHWQLGCLVSRGRRCVFPSAPPEIASTLNAHNARFFAPFDSNTKQKKRTPKTPMPSSTSSAPPQPFILLLWHSLFCKRRRQAESPPPPPALLPLQVTQQVMRLCSRLAAAAPAGGGGAAAAVEQRPRHTTKHLPLSAFLNTACIVCMCVRVRRCFPRLQQLVRRLSFAGGQHAAPPLVAAAKPGRTRELLQACGRQQRHFPQAQTKRAPICRPRRAHPAPPTFFLRAAATKGCSHCRRPRARCPLARDVLAAPPSGHLGGDQADSRRG